MRLGIFSTGLLGFVAGNRIRDRLLQELSGGLAPLQWMDNIRRPYILVVEDENMIRWIAVEGLEDAGYPVLEAENAAEALRMLNARRDVGVLFTDVNMPGALDGLALAELVHAKWPDISLIVTSARGLDRAVPDDGSFLAKPYSVEEITEAVGMQIKKKDV